MNEDANEFSQMLRRFRRQAGLSQEELAEKACLSRNSVSDLERGLRATPRRDTLALIAEALKLNPAQRAALERSARESAAGALGGLSAAVLAPAQTQAGLPALLGRVEDLAAAERLLDGSQPAALVFLGSWGMGKSRILHSVAAMATERGWQVHGPLAAEPGNAGPALLERVKRGATEKLDKRQRSPAAGTATLAELLRLCARPLGNLILVDDAEQCSRADLDGLLGLSGDRASPVALCLGWGAGGDDGPGSAGEWLRLRQESGAIQLRELLPLRWDQVPAWSGDADHFQAETGGAPRLIQAVQDPAGLRQSMERLLAGLSGPARDSLCLLALSGSTLRTAGLKQCLEALGHPGLEAVEAAERLVRLGLVQGSAGAYWIAARGFAQAVQDCVNPARLARCHAVLAELFELVDEPYSLAKAAGHFLAADQADRAVAARHRAGVRSEQLVDFAGARAHFEAALGYRGLDRWRPLEFKTARALLVLLFRDKAFEPAQALIDQALATLRAEQRIVEQIPFQEALMQCQYLQGHKQEAFDIGRAFFHVARGLNASPELASYFAIRSYVHFLIQDEPGLVSCVALAEQALTEDADPLTRLVVGRARMRVHGMRAEFAATARLLREELIPLSEIMGDLRESLVNHLNLISTSQTVGDLAGARASLERAKELLVHHPSPNYQGFAHSMELGLAFDGGDWSGLWRRFEEYSGGLEENPFRQEIMLQAYRLAWLQGKDEPARNYLVAANGGKDAQNIDALMYHNLAAERALWQDDPQRAALALAILESPAWRDRPGFDEVQVLLRVAKAACLAPGDPEHARLRREIDGLIKRSEEGGIKPAWSEALVYRAWLHRRLGDCELAMVDLGTALDLEEAMDRPYFKARILALRSLCRPDALGAELDRLQAKRIAAALGVAVLPGMDAKAPDGMPGAVAVPAVEGRNGIT